MSGETTNVRIWEEADVYFTDVVEDITTIAPDDLDAEWPEEWIPLGLLGEDDGIGETRTNQTSDKYAYGSILVRVTRSQEKETYTWAFLEDTDSIFKLLNPDSLSEVDGDVTHRTYVVPNKSNIKAYGLERRDGDIISRIVIPTGEITEGGTGQWQDDELYERPVTMTLYPDGDKVTKHEWTNDPQAQPESAS